MAKCDSVLKPHSKLTWKEYLESDIWRCPKAELAQSNPRGAHHWVAVEAESEVFKCIYCGQVKLFRAEILGLTAGK